MSFKELSFNHYWKLLIKEKNFDFCDVSENDQIASHIYSPQENYLLNYKYIRNNNNNSEEKHAF